MVHCSGDQAASIEAAIAHQHITRRPPAGSTEMDAATLRPQAQRQIREGLVRVDSDNQAETAAAAKRSKLLMKPLTRGMTVMS